MYKKIFFIGGFHRSGSTLLGSILCQNEKIHIEGKSALCQMMWDASASIKNSYNLLNANGRGSFDKDLISEIPKIYYKDIKRPIIFDKNPWWTHAANTEIISKYIGENFKMLVLYRDAEEIIKSFYRIYYKNNIPLTQIRKDLFVLQSNAKSFFEILESNNTDNYLFISYDSIVFDTKSTIKKIYQFTGMQQYNHSFNDIKKYPTESSNFHGIDGLYEVRSKIEKIQNDFKLDRDSLSVCKKINERIKSYQGISIC